MIGATDCGIVLVLYLAGKFEGSVWRTGQCIDASEGHAQTAESASLARVYALSGSARPSPRTCLPGKEPRRCRSPLPLSFGYGFASLGKTTPLLNGLDKAFEAHDMWINFLKVDPKMDSLRRSPRHIEFVATRRVPD